MTETTRAAETTTSLTTVTRTTTYPSVRFSLRHQLNWKLFWNKALALQTQIYFYIWNLWTDKEMERKDKNTQEKKLIGRYRNEGYRQANVASQGLERVVLWVATGKVDHHRHAHASYFNSMGSQVTPFSALFRAYVYIFLHLCASAYKNITMSQKIQYVHFVIPETSFQSNLTNGSGNIVEIYAVFSDKLVRNFFVGVIHLQFSMSNCVHLTDQIFTISYIPTSINGNAVPVCWSRFRWPSDHNW